jgi:hypothetical protein
MRQARHRCIQSEANAAAAEAAADNRSRAPRIKCGVRQLARATRNIENRAAPREHKSLSHQCFSFH